MTGIDLEVLSDWLGPEGAVAGLDKSRLTNSDLMMLARENGILVDKKTARRQIAIEIIMSPEKRIAHEQDRLLEMSKDELQRYFSDHMVSTKELMSVLESLGIAPKGKLRGKLSEFAANEISDLGMYQRVARGKQEFRGHNS
ncbi:MAG: hypothetical protein H7X93_10300 [Sphingomonadaceae bacterium]|nr:hypothetical protein [Sphingomonadaceae bacterium]